MRQYEYRLLRLIKPDMLPYSSIKSINILNKLKV